MEPIRDKRVLKRKKGALGCEVRCMGKFVVKRGMNKGHFLVLIVFYLLLYW